jgi:hypothetical protein
MATEKGLIGLHQHVENRIADPENVIFSVGHLTVLLQRSRKAAAYHGRPEA